MIRLQFAKSSKKFEVDVHNAILDGVLNQLDRRFSKRDITIHYTTVWKSVIRVRLHVEIWRKPLDGIASLLPEINVSNTIR